MDHTPELPPRLKSTAVVEDDDSYCPQLPPHLQRQQHRKKTSDDAKDKDDDDYYCPQLPPHLQRLGEDQAASSSSSNESGDEFCPALPPHLLNNRKEAAGTSSSARILGPSFAPDDYKSEYDAKDGCHSEESDVADGEVYGPLPAAQPVDMDEYIEKTIEKRTKAMKDKITGKDTPKVIARESWMLELPEDQPLFSGLGLQARTFLRKEKLEKGDTSVWTDTPADKERKAQRAAERKGASEEAPEVEVTPEQIAARQRDEQLERLVEEYNAKKRPAPLVDTHIADKKARSGDDTSLTGVGRDRKPFSREDDMHVNKFDEATRTTILKKARQLNDRFSSGKVAKFL